MNFNPWPVVETLNKVLLQNIGPFLIENKRIKLLNDLICCTYNDQEITASDFPHFLASLLSGPVLENWHDE